MTTFNPTMDRWIVTTRDKLLQAETKRIEIRAECWQQIINQCTQTIIAQIAALKGVNVSVQPFKYKPTMSNIQTSFLSYLLSWDGLNTKLINTSNQPKSMKEYQQKSKNWVNGCRAKEYAKHLYPAMIYAVEKYAEMVSECELFKFDDECIQILRDILMYSYFVKLCETQVSVLNSRRTVSLLCDNSVKARKTNTTRKIFQSYAIDHNYNDKFPAHRNEAIDYFTSKTTDRFKSLFNIIERKEVKPSISIKPPNIENVVNNKNEVNTAMVYNIMNHIATNCKTHNGDRVNIDKNIWNALLSAAQQLEINDIENKREIDDLTEKIIKLDSSINAAMNTSIHSINSSPEIPITPIKMECDIMYQQQCDTDMNLNVYNDYDIMPMNIDDGYNHDYDSDDHFEFNAI